MRHSWVFADYDYRCMNCHWRMLHKPTASDWDGCDPGWIPIGARIVRTMADSAHRDAENLNRRGTITGYSYHPALAYYVIMFDGDDEPTRYVTSHRGIVELSAIDQLAEIGRIERARLALERGMRDGLRMQDGVSADQVCAELADDPP